jgi:SAM-dependent methyltransferase
MSALGVLHEELVFNRRLETLAEWFAKLVPSAARVLEVGGGDGLISAVLQSRRPDLTVTGIDGLPRAHTHIPVEIFNGSRIPFADASFDVALFSDVLHHTPDPTTVLHEARRVATHSVLIKDHKRDGVAAGARLRFMDWVGNARFGVALPYNYWTMSQGRDAWQEIGLHADQIITDLGLYPLPANWIFGAKLRFIARLTKCSPVAK